MRALFRIAAFALAPVAAAAVIHGNRWFIG